MKAKLTKLLAILTCFAMLFVSIPTNGTYAGTEGKTFEAGQVYQMNTNINILPKTMEAWIKLPKNVSDRGGVILGNYASSSATAFSFEIFNDGVPRIYFNKPNGASGDHKFTDVDIRSDTWTHLAFSWENDVVTCYVNGENKGSANVAYPTTATYNMNNALCIGSDLRSKNTQYFKGAIKQVAIYNDARTQAEIQSDMNALDVNDANMMMAFNLTSDSNIFKDISSHGYVCKAKWLNANDINIPTNYDFSFMAIGDTQIITESYPDQLSKVYDYVVNNVQSKKVKHVFGLGDITNSDTDKEWEIAKAQIARMDGVVPYSIIRGNHDIYSANRKLNVTSKYDTIYGPTTSPYAKQYTYCYEEEGADFRARNTVHFFSSNTRDYMVVALDFGANDNILRWASDIIKAHPYHNVIVTTHCYLYRDGTTLDSTENCPPTRDYGSTANNGDHMWSEFVSKHENIVLVLSGHDPSEQLVITQTPGEKGNIVTQMLIDPQGMDVGDAKGMVATFYVAENGEDVTVEWYSTTKNKYFKTENNYTFKLNVIEREAAFTVSFNANGGSGKMASIESGRNVTLPTCTFTAPAKNYVFKGWATTKNGQVITTSTTKITANTTFYAIWEEVVLESYNISIVGGTASLSSATCGTLVTIKAEAKEGKVFKEWYGVSDITFTSGSKSSIEATFEMPNKAISIIAVYEDIQEATFKIHASVIGSGQISSKGYTIVDNGASKTYTITPAQGFKIKDVKVNGVSVGAVESYTFSSVSQDNFIVAEFEKITESDSGNNTPDTPPTIDNNSGSGLPIGAVIGIIAGAVIILGGAVVVIILKVKKK